MTESVMVGRESDMQECPPRGSPVCPPRGSPVFPHRQACPPSRRDSHCETLKLKDFSMFLNIFRATVMCLNFV